MAFGDNKVENYRKNPIFIDDIDSNKIVVSYKVSFGKKDFKYFIGYKDNETLNHYV